jgi:hypothetical protein
MCSALATRAGTTRIQDAGEPGVPGVTVNLMDCANNVLASDVTDANGYYSFTGLEPGDYRIRVVAPTGYTFSPKDQGGDDSLDSDADAAGIMACTTLDEGENDTTWDAGLVWPCGEGKDKVTKLTLRYDGTKAAKITVVQKWPSVTVFSGTVQPGGEFSFSGTGDQGMLGTEIYITIGRLQKITIDTSCAKPIGPGLVKGLFTVISGYSRDGGLLCPL